MKQKRHRPEQIVRKLRQAEVELSKGATVEAICKRLGVSEQTYYRWRKKYAGMGSNQLRRLKQLERDNARLKKIVGEQAMDIDVLKEVASKNW